MDAETIQTIIQGGILVTTIYIAAKTGDGGTDKPKGGPTSVRGASDNDDNSK